jgi:hypothetical protein
MKKMRRKAMLTELFDAPKPVLRARSGAVLIDEAEFDEFENVCGSVKRTITPRVGTNTNNQQRYLVNGHHLGGELVRTVRTVECLGGQRTGERESCGAVFGRRTECRQEHTEHRMVAIDMERGELVVETFTFPSCCSCMVHRGLGM